jgi:hypothetical protein
MKTLMPHTILVLVLILAGVGCGGDAAGDVMDPCSGRTALSGLYVSDSPVMSMDLSQCGSRVTGTLIYGGREYDLDGAVEDDVFSFSTEQLDLCDTSGSRRSVNSSYRDFAVLDGADSLDGNLQVRDAFCASGRSRVQQSPAVFERR